MKGLWHVQLINALEPVHRSLQGLGQTAARLEAICVFSPHSELSSQGPSRGMKLLSLISLTHGYNFSTQSQTKDTCSSELCDGKSQVVREKRLTVKLKVKRL